MKYNDITTKNDQELTTLLAESQTQLGKLAIEMRTKKVSNVKQIAAVKKTIARVLTAQRARQLEAGDTPESKKEENHG